MGKIEIDMEEVRRTLEEIDRQTHNLQFSRDEAIKKAIVEIEKEFGKKIEPLREKRRIILAALNMFLDKGPKEASREH